ncbi:hypothetical protein B0H14DRAFT_2616386 [Mycena olivaceomarginata]|nr:hypothetical protein B0H14DRAFT_2616386 [Mycena olivaceomarginata]
MTEERPPSSPATTELPSSSSPSTTEPPASSSTEEAPRQNKIQLFTHRAQGCSPPLSFPPLVSPLICMGTAILKYDRPSTIIANLGPPYTMVERLAHHRLIVRQRADLERDAGIDRMIAQIALLLEITDWGEWQATREAHLVCEAEVEAARHQRRRDQKRLAIERDWRNAFACGAFLAFVSSTDEDNAHRAKSPSSKMTSISTRHALHSSPSSPDYTSSATSATISNPTPSRIDAGHSNCYVCIRISLETTWECPTCEERISARPVPNDDEQRAIDCDYPNWDQSRVNYAWDGLVFPTTQLP